MKTTFNPAIKANIPQFFGLLVVSLGALAAASAAPDLLGERGLPRILLNPNSEVGAKMGFK
jgi:hypothetical protein